MTDHWKIKPAQPVPGDKVCLSNAALRTIGGMGPDLYGNPHPWVLARGVLLEGGTEEHANVQWEGTGYLPTGPTQRWMLEKVTD
jgi:hypothetical protein